MPQVSSDAPILATKLFVPAPRDHVVHRARLRDRLAAARGGRVTLVAAAAGWGKSTLLAEWALDAQGRVAWLSLDPTDDEPRQFLSYVIEALRAAQCLDAGERLDVLSLKPEAIRATATELLNAIAARGAPVSLVLDDYHVIESRDVHDALPSSSAASSSAAFEKRQHAAVVARVTGIFSGVGKSALLGEYHGHVSANLRYVRHPFDSQRRASQLI